MGLLVENCTFSGTNGTAPQAVSSSIRAITPARQDTQQAPPSSAGAVAALIKCFATKTQGVDIEPDNSLSTLVDIVFRQCRFIDNAGSGVKMVSARQNSLTIYLL